MRSVEHLLSSVVVTILCSLCSILHFFFGDGSNTVAFQADRKWQACSNGVCGLLQQADGAGLSGVRSSRAHGAGFLGVRGVRRWISQREILERAHFTSWILIRSCRKIG